MEGALTGSDGPQQTIARALPPRSHPCALFAVKAFHSAAFWAIQSAIFYLLYKGVKDESDGRAAVAFSIAAGESMIYAGNGFRCPLTGLAEGLGAERGAVTDIFLPKWLASNVANIYVPILVAGIVLHARNMLRRGTRVPARTLVPRGDSSLRSE